MVKIIVLNLNTKEQLKKCLTAIRKNTARGTYQIHIIDQGSDDGSVEYLKNNWTDKPDVKLEFFGANRGIYRGWWHAYHFETKRAEHDVVLLGSDTEVQRGWLDELQDLAHLDEKIGLVSSKLLKRAGLIPGKKKPRYFVCFGGSRDDDPKNPHIVGFEDKDKKGFFLIDKEYEWVTFSCVYIKADCLNDVGFFDFRFIIWCGDRDYCYRARQKGWKVYYCGKSRVLHEESVTVSQFKGKVMELDDGRVLPFSQIEKMDQEYFHQKWNK